MTENKRYTVSFDLGFSFDVEVKAKNGREAKRKAFAIFLRRFASKMSNYNIEWYCTDDGEDGGDSALAKMGYKGGFFR